MNSAHKAVQKLITKSLKDQRNYWGYLVDPRRWSGWWSGPRIKSAQCKRKGKRTLLSYPTWRIHPPARSKHESECDCDSCALYSAITPAKTITCNRIFSLVRNARGSEQVGLGSTDHSKCTKRIAEITEIMIGSYDPHDFSVVYHRSSHEFKLQKLVRRTQCSLPNWHQHWPEKRNNPKIFK